jgi:hypothetical protein
VFLLLCLVAPLGRGDAVMLSAPVVPIDAPTRHRPRNWRCMGELVAATLYKSFLRHGDGRRWPDCEPLDRSGRPTTGR